MTGKKFLCSDCGSEWNTKAKLNGHMKSHLPVKQLNSFLCNFCSLTLTSVTKLRRHQKFCDKAIKKIVVAVNESPNQIDKNSKDSNMIKESMFNKMQSLLESPSKSVNTSTSKRNGASVHKGFSIENMSMVIKKSLKPITKTLDTTQKNRPQPKSSINNKTELASIQAAKSTIRPKIIKKAKENFEKGICEKEMELLKSLLPESSSQIPSNESVKAAKEPNKNVNSNDSSEIITTSGNSSIKKRKTTKPSVPSVKKKKQKQMGNEGTQKDGIEITEEESAVNDNIELEERIKPFSCVKCQKLFTRKYHLDRHLLVSSCSDQTPQKFSCEVCNKVYSRKDNLREHLRHHTGGQSREKKFKCEFCGKAFHGQSLLTIHVRTHTGERPFHCDICPKKFSSSGALSKHRRIHTGEKPFKCDSCEMSFSLNGTLKRHLRVHTGQKPHKCMYCSKEFIQIGGLKAHMFFHTGENGFKCEECGRVFNRKARLQMHRLYVHMKFRPFVCKVCQKNFTRKEDLHRHSLFHSGEKPFKCPTCEKNFASRPSLKLHLLTHTKEEPRSCHECGRAFIRKDCLLRHIRKRHRDLLDKILTDEKEENDSAFGVSRMLSKEDLCDNITELLGLLVEEATLVGFGWPQKPVDEVLESVIRRCGHTPVTHEGYSFVERLRENSKLLFTVVIDDNAVKTLLNNQTVDEVILHVLRLAKT